MFLLRLTRQIPPQAPRGRGKATWLSSSSSASTMRTQSLLSAGPQLKELSNCDFRQPQLSNDSCLGRPSWPRILAMPPLAFDISRQTWQPRCFATPVRGQALRPPREPPHERRTCCWTRHTPTRRSRTATRRRAEENTSHIGMVSASRHQSA